jgi:hypothetical protein
MASNAARTDAHGDICLISTKVLAERNGITTEAIRKWEKSGWVVRDPETRLIDYAATMALVDANRSLTNGGKPDRGVGAVKPTTTSESTPTPPPEPQTQTPAIPQSFDHIPIASEGINNIKAYRERNKAIKELIELKQSLSELIPVAAAERMYGAAISSLLQNLESIAPRVAPIFATMTDEFQIRQYLQHEIDNAMRNVVIPDLAASTIDSDTEDDSDSIELPAETAKPATTTKPGDKKRASSRRVA